MAVRSVQEKNQNSHYKKIPKLPYKVNCIVQNQKEQAEALKVDSSEGHFGEIFTLYQHSKLFTQILEFHIGGNLKETRLPNQTKDWVEY